MKDRVLRNRSMLGTCLHATVTDGGGAVIRRGRIHKSAGGKQKVLSLCCLGCSHVHNTVYNQQRGAETPQNAETSRAYAKGVRFYRSLKLT